jgi:hypothetical protein
MSAARTMASDNNWLLFPAVRAVLTVPFWLPAAPRPLPVGDRKEMLRRAATALNQSRHLAAYRMRWEAVELGWSREPYTINLPAIWHPKASVSRKGTILKGVFTDPEAPPALSAQGNGTIAIVERSILYYDYGICSLEYVFEFLPAANAAADWLDPAFWRQFRARIMAAVENRELAALAEPAWSNLQHAIVEAFSASIGWIPGPLEGGRRRRRRASSAGMLPIKRIFGLHQPKVRRGHLCASFGINFILFCRGRPEFGADPLNRLFEAFLGGRPIGDADSKARSEHLAYVFYGAVHTLVIVRGTPQTPETSGVVEAARALLRYLWMGYGVLAEASRGLMALQAAYYIGYATPSLRQEQRVNGMIRDLEVAGQIFDLLIAEFHFSMFWESEIEYDIYHPAYAQWRMPELATFVRDNLAALARTADALRRSLEVRRQRLIGVLLGAIATLGIIGAVNSLFSFSHWKLLFLKLDYPLQEEWEGTVTLLVLVLCLILMFVVYSLNRERRNRG